MADWEFAAYVALGLCVLSWIWTKISGPGFNVAHKHVFVTGGSLGIGLEVAKKYAAAGAKVSIISRNEKNLKTAKAAIESVQPKEGAEPVFTQSCDVTDYAAVQASVQAATKFHGRAVDFLVCSAGIIPPKYFIEHDVAEHHRLFDVNYFGVVHAINAALPGMLKEPADQRRRIIIVSSALGLASWVGYTQYSGSKFALRGLAEALRNELKMYNIDVSIFYPSNCDTPGFDGGSDGPRPIEARIIAAPSAVATPAAAATALINGVKNGEFAITNDPLIFLLRIIGNGVTPRVNTPLEVLLMPIVVVIQSVFVWFMDTVVVLCAHYKARAKAGNPNAGYTFVCNLLQPQKKAAL
ncbi:hypothetical protein Poli38472_010434 [Pythium oligandrum]|uniref:3-dehydrosphinganine reductase n=1 Tax=Pythium oligandrum TaxID=41045 RepID=A0A8K1C328_PYTOL|nr:hypothetical protein Poli38472_010434 [Pythium oligandrum]|eukprot:TMW55552.1 hypothetical protein Poli38472_010434 [Pythium oligandrum]